MRQYCIQLKIQITKNSQFLQHSSSQIFVRKFLILLLLTTICGQIFSCSADASLFEEEEKQGVFTLLTYNVRGIPILAPTGSPDPRIKMALISPLLNNYDIALVQEDFFFHDTIVSKAVHPYKSTPKASPEEYPKHDGLNRFSIFPFTVLKRQAWGACSDDESYDCWVDKGFSVAQTTINKNINIDIYNLHMDAGGTAADISARRRQVEMLLSEIAQRSNENPIIVAGDFNLDIGRRAQDDSLFTRLIEATGLRDVCEIVSCAESMIDKALFRNSTDVKLLPALWKNDSDFVDEAGAKLSDHYAIGVTFNWQVVK